MTNSENIKFIVLYIKSVYRHVRHWSSITGRVGVGGLQNGGVVLLLQKGGGGRNIF